MKWLWLFLVLQACERGSARICDGTGNLRLGLAVLPAADPARTAPGSQVIWDNGERYLYIDGTCRYWVATGQDTWGVPRSGLLDETSEKAVVDALLFNEWPRLDGVFGPPSGWFDIAPLVLYEGPIGQPSIVCIGCSHSSAPRELQFISSGYNDLLGGLWEAGTELQGAVRFAATAVERQEGIHQFDWPLLDVELEAVAISVEQSVSFGYGQGQVTRSAEAAEAMRELRRQYLAHEVSTYIGYIPVMDANGRTFALYTRDSLPIEDENGLVRPIKPAL